MKVDYLRISLTDRCNFNCIYCRPYKRIKILNRADLLSFEEIVDFIRLVVKFGIRKIRLTGGEPLIRKGVIELINMISKIEEIKEISMTTNGAKLEEFASGLKKAGLSRINVSLDSLNEKKFTQITGYNGLSRVLRGIRIATEAGLNPVKINTVVLGGINDDEILDLVEFSQKNYLIVRFIEYMPINGMGNRKWYVSNEIVRNIIEKRWGKLKPVPFIGNGPARYFVTREGNIPVGFISFISHPFCKECNRLRLTCDGKLRPCLISDFEVDVKNALRSKRNREKNIGELFKEAVDFKVKREKKFTGFDFKRAGKFMFQIGG